MGLNVVYEEKRDVIERTAQWIATPLFDFNAKMYDPIQFKSHFQSQSQSKSETYVYFAGLTLHIPYAIYTMYIK